MKGDAPSVQSNSKQMPEWKVTPLDIALQKKCAEALIMKWAGIAPPNKLNDALKRADRKKKVKSTSKSGKVVKGRKLVKREKKIGEKKIDLKKMHSRKDESTEDEDMNPTNSKSTHLATVLELPLKKRVPGINQRKERKYP